MIPERGGCGALFFFLFLSLVSGRADRLERGVGEGKHCSRCREWRRDAEAEAEGSVRDEGLMGVA